MSLSQLWLFLVVALLVLAALRAAMPAVDLMLMEAWDVAPVEIGGADSDFSAGLASAGWHRLAAGETGPVWRRDGTT